MKTSLNPKSADSFFVKRLAESIVRRQDRTRSAEALLREECKLHRERLGPDGQRMLAHCVASWFRWLRFTKEVPAARRLDQALLEDNAFSKDESLHTERKLRHAVPDWVAGMVQDAPADWHRALQREPVLWLRARPGCAREILQAIGEHACSVPQPALPDLVRYPGARDVFRMEVFTTGRAEAQDPASHLVGLACAPRGGDTWWDACAGEGGKTMHLADLMQNRGLIWASDKAEWRLDTLRKRAARLERFNLRVARWAGGAQLPTLTRFDGVLVDAPCSGLGTWHRDPWARWTTRIEDFAELAQLQSELLAHAAVAVKPGGRLVYAVCTVTRAETHEVVDAFEKAHPDFSPAPLELPVIEGVCPDPGAARVQIWQGAAGFNGMFIAAWKRR